MSRRRHDDGWLSLGGAAKALGLDSDTGRELLRFFATAGHLPVVEVKPGVHRIRQEDVEALRERMAAARDTP